MCRDVVGIASEEGKDVLYGCMVLRTRQRDAYMLPARGVVTRGRVHGHGLARTINRGINWEIKLVMVMLSMGFALSEITLWVLPL